MKNLVIQIKGEITKSNFPAWKKELIKQIKEADIELKTDEDFINAKSTVTILKTAEKSLLDAKAEALKQAEDIQLLFNSIDEVSQQCRESRLSLDKQIVVRNKELKEDAIAFACDAVRQELDNLNEQENISSVFAEINIDNYFSLIRDSAKNRKTLDSIRSSCNDQAEEIIDQLHEYVSHIQHNRKILTAVQEEYRPLFQDRKNLLSVSEDVLHLEIDKRIAIYKAQKLEQEELERQRKEQEELERQRKEQEELERQRKEQEELERQRKEQEVAAEQEPEEEQVQAEESETPVASEPEPSPPPVSSPPPVTTTQAPTHDINIPSFGTPIQPEPQQTSEFHITVAVSADLQKAQYIAKSIRDTTASYEEVGTISLRKVN